MTEQVKRERGKSICIYKLRLHIYLYSKAIVVTELIVQDKQIALFVLPVPGGQFKFYAFIISSNVEPSQSSTD